MRIVFLFCEEVSSSVRKGFLFYEEEFLFYEERFPLRFPLLRRGFLF
jgi:hypothetical protein